MAAKPELVEKLSTALRTIAAEGVASSENADEPSQAMIDLLAALVGENTCSTDDNRIKPTAPLMEAIAAALEQEFGIKSAIVYQDNDGNPSKDGPQASLACRIGPDAEGGIWFTSHLDTVWANKKRWYKELDPFALTREGDRLYGRGTVDMKSQAAGILATLAVLAKHQGKMTEPVTVMFNWGEETARNKGRGGVPAAMEALGKLSKILDPKVVDTPDAGDESHIVLGHRGFFTLAVDRKIEAVTVENQETREVTIRLGGVSGHSSDPRNGVNALERVAELVTALNGKDAPLPFKIISMTTGNNADNVIPERATLKIAVPAGDEQKLRQWEKYLAGKIENNAADCRLQFQAAREEQRAEGLQVPEAEIDKISSNVKIADVTKEPITDISAAFADLTEMIMYAKNLQRDMIKNVVEPPFLPAYPTINQASLQTENGVARIRISVRAADEKNASMMLNRLQQKVFRIRKKHNLGSDEMETHTLARTSGVPMPSLSENGEFEVVARIMEAETGHKPVAAVESGAADLGGYREALARLGKNPLCMESSIANADVNDAHGNAEYTTLWEYLKAALKNIDLAAIFSGLGTIGQLESKDDNLLVMMKRSKEAAAATTV